MLATIIEIHKIPQHYYSTTQQTNQYDNITTNPYQNKTQVTVTYNNKIHNSNNKNQQPNLIT